MSLGFLWGTGWSWKWIHVPVAFFFLWLAVWIMRAGVPPALRGWGGR